MSSRTISFRFEELPLLIVNGFSAGLVNGSALINYWPDGAWGISQIYLDGHRPIARSDVAAGILAGIPNAKRFDERDILLDRGDRINDIIWSRLEEEWRPQVQEAVGHAIEEERISQLEGV